MLTKQRATRAKTMRQILMDALRLGLSAGLICTPNLVFVQFFCLAFCSQPLSLTIYGWNCKNTKPRKIMVRQSILEGYPVEIYVLTRGSTLSVEPHKSSTKHWLMAPLSLFAPSQPQRRCYCRCLLDLLLQRARQLLCRKGSAWWAGNGFTQLIKFRSSPKRIRLARLAPLEGAGTACGLDHVRRPSGHTQP